MNLLIENFSLEKELILDRESDSPFKIRTTSLSVSKQENQIIECHLTFWVTLQLYDRIDRENLFNLKPEIRSPFSAGEFQYSESQYSESQDSTDIQITATLEPALISKLAENGTDAEQVALYIERLNQQEPKHPILSSYSWYALEFKQQKESGETGYRTLWTYLKPFELAKQGINTKDIDSKTINEAMLNFAASWGDIPQVNIQTDGQTDSQSIDPNNYEDSVDVISPVTEEMIHTFEELTSNLSEMTEEMVSESIKEINDAFEEVTDSISGVSRDINSSETIFQAIINFFVEDNWQFSYLKAEPIVRVNFQGKNAQWDCYVKVIEEKQQFAFYSICPIRTRLNKRLPVTEFITRANYGMIMGNFEFDFTSGEIRYKTSIDVEGDNLSFALIKQVVYANVTVMDEYLPSLIAVIEGKAGVREALAQIEV